MTRFIDAQGRSWDNAEDALHEFLHDLPDLTHDQFTRFVIDTSAFAPAEENLAAMYKTVKNDPELSDIFGYYPVPFPDAFDPDLLIGKVFTVTLPVTLTEEKPPGHGRMTISTPNLQQDRPPGDLVDKILRMINREFKTSPLSRLQDYPPAREALLNTGFADPGWKWNDRVPDFMNAVVPSWDVDNVPLFQQQRQAFNRRILARINGPIPKGVKRLKYAAAYAASDDTLDRISEER